MLKSLFISNYALIEELEIQFCQGFNIITGETGAGKSILLGALGLIMGQRADLGVLQDKSRKTTVEGIFDLSGYQLKSFFSDHDLDYDDQSILRRELTPSGKSRAFINDTPVILKVLQQLASLLVDIHSQHQNLELSRSEFQMNVVDILAGNENLLLGYKVLYREFNQTSHRLSEYLEKADKAKADLDYFEFQFKQLDEANLKAEEQTTLENELDTLEHAEEIKLTLNELSVRMDEETTGILPLMKEQFLQLKKMGSFLKEAQDLAARMDSCYLELNDISSEFALLGERTELDPERSLLIRERLDLLYSLEQKYRVNSVDELLKVRDDFDEKIRTIASFDQQIKTDQQTLEKLTGQLKKQGQQLSASRQKVAPEIENEVGRILHQLGMTNAILQLQFKVLEHPGTVGIDEIHFLFSANKNGEPRDIAQVASGGELSRVMLALKSLLAKSRSLPTIIFDEIDTGISGEVAVKMGTILKAMSQGVQTINITHLPQIAAKGDHHFMVYKYDRDDHTYTSMRKLTASERIEELAQMLSGKPASQTARKTARELLELGGN